MVCFRQSHYWDFMSQRTGVEYWELKIYVVMNIEGCGKGEITWVNYDLGCIKKP